MSKQDKLKTKNCSLIQEKIFELIENDIALKSDLFLSEHINKCQNCQQFRDKLYMIRKRLPQSPSVKLKPDSRILRNIISYKKIKKGLNNSKPNRLWVSLREIFEYRVPVYQALSGAVVVFMLFLYLSNSIVSTGDKAILIEYSGDYEELTSSELYLVDTLSLNKPVRGQNAKEDSVLMSFLVPTM